MTDKKPETYQPVSRGLADHFCRWSDAAKGLFTFCLLKCKPLGDDKGIYEESVINILNGMGWKNRKKFYKTIKELDEYLEIKYSQSRYTPIKIKILGYKTASDFYRTQKGTSAETHRTPGGTTTFKKGTTTFKKGFSIGVLWQCLYRWHLRIQISHGQEYR